jgi:TonB family protein
MITPKLLILFVAASLAGHGLVLALALTTRVGWQAAPRFEQVLTVDIKTPAEATGRGKQPPARDVPPPVLPERPALPEDSVTLEGRGGPYDAYLLSVRKRIERLWHYPPRALAEKQEGNAVIHFTIDAAGALTACRVTDTSGSPLLDESALIVVRTAAPYSPFPGNFPIARLNITATFSYQIGP